MDLVLGLLIGVVGFIGVILVLTEIAEYDISWGRIVSIFSIFGAVIFVLLATLFTMDNNFKQDKMYPDKFMFKTVSNCLDNGHYEFSYDKITFIKISYCTKKPWTSNLTGRTINFYYKDDTLLKIDLNCSSEIDNYIFFQKNYFHRLAPEEQKMLKAAIEHYKLQ